MKIFKYSIIVDVIYYYVIYIYIYYTSYRYMYDIYIHCIYIYIIYIYICITLYTYIIYLYTYIHCMLWWYSHSDMSPPQNGRSKKCLFAKTRQARVCAAHQCLGSALACRCFWGSQMLFFGYSLSTNMAVCQNLVPLVNIKIAGKWMFIPLKMYL